MKKKSNNGYCRSIVNTCSFQISQPFLQGYIVPSLTSKSLLELLQEMKASTYCSRDIGNSESSISFRKEKKHVLVPVTYAAFKTGTNSCYIYYRFSPFHLHFSCFFLFLFPFLFCLHIFPDLRKLLCKMFWQFLFIQGEKNAH